MTDVVIIGAGSAGISCARVLRTAGVPVRMIDKGRGIGGRVATRRVDVAGEVITFDHGAQYLDQDEDTTAIAALVPEAVAPWEMGDGKARLVGAPGMSALPKALAKGLDITFNTRVLSLREIGDQWNVETDTDPLTASHVILTIPAPQVAQVLGEAHPVAQQAAQAVMLPCMTLMATFDPDTATPFVTRRDPDADLTWIARNDAKPARSDAYRTWVAHAHPDWSAKHIDADRAETKARMVALLCATLDIDPAKLRHAGLQGWRYGLVYKPLGQPFVSQGTLWAGGDWCCGPKIQDAWRSGAHIAENVLQSLGRSAA